MLKDMLEKQPRNRKLAAIAAILVLLACGERASAQVPDENYMAGTACLLKGEYAKASENYTLAITRNNADERLFIRRGESWLKQKDYDRAADDFMEANLIDPGVADLWLARCYALSGDNEKAFTYLTSHLKSPFRIASDSIKKDRAFDLLQDSPEWYSTWQNDWYNEEEKLAAEANYYRRKKQPDQAQQILSSGMGEYPESIALFSLKGAVSYDQGNYAASIADYSRALEIDKAYIPAYRARGMAYLKAGRFRDAVNDFNRVLKDDPADFRLYQLRSEAYAGLRSWDPAIKDMLVVLKYFGEDQDILYRCGELYYQAGDYINALKYFNLNLRDDPNNSAYFKSRGKTYLKTSTYRYAVSDLSMSLDLNPDDAETWMFLGLAKIQSGDKENGCSCLDKAQKMGNAEALKYIVDTCQ